MIVVKCCYTFFANIALVQIKLLMKMNRICELFDIQYSVIQGGTVWNTRMLRENKRSPGQFSGTF